ncbi:hypothetical protein CDAR_15831 [Caerostris darwini]|uniref:Uncharacterized protein n=1 Tax=Caerostris darwini TaxID=1538125 RepID=A0AAV4N893_9ARAC|nr:hypothetical protein CDAR_15831 [Caerostris darwini]
MQFLMPCRMMKSTFAMSFKVLSASQYKRKIISSKLNFKPRAQKYRGCIFSHTIKCRFFSHGQRNEMRFRPEELYFNNGFRLTLFQGAPILCANLMYLMALCPR